MKLTSLCCAALLTLSLGQIARAEPEDAAEARAERQKQQLLRKLESSLGRKTEGPVVYALYVVTGQPTPQQPNARPNIEVRVQSAMGRKAAAEAIYAFMESGEGWNGPAKEGERPAANATTSQGSRSFRYLKSFKEDEQADAQTFIAEAETGLKKEIEVAAQQQQAFQQYLQQMQSRNRGYPQQPRPGQPR